uniref:glycine dehydrogenase (aminomethyl-transferring) n=1 Tax=Candidatus Methanomethylicus mesodigestus TaxID=1867258 RepID=A0A7C3F0X4_9CREN
MFRQARYDEPTLFELSREGRIGVLMDVPWDMGGGGGLQLDAGLLREDLKLPEISQVGVIRHYTRLSQMNWGVDSGTYPLGSCTMKYNPRLNEDMSSDDRVQLIHPWQDVSTVQGALKLMSRLEWMLCALTGMSRFSLQPAAGANGELAGCLMIRKYHRDAGDLKRDEMIVPDTAHGTNPASASMAGFKVVEMPTGSDGEIDLELLKGALSERTAGMMMTNPNTLGIFESNVTKISEAVHSAGGIMYYDGANLQGMLGMSRPGDLGFDIVHLNLHKTFSTPHGGGGPGSGPVGATAKLEGYLPVPLVSRNGGSYYWDYDVPHSIGKVRGGGGSFPILVRAYCYILSMGLEGLKSSCAAAVLNTNYFAKKVEGIRGLNVAYPSRLKKHEVVVSAEEMARETGVTALDLSKALLERGIHAPTIYFPQRVKQALMFEFADSESKEEIDRCVASLMEISEAAYSEPQQLKGAPSTTSRKRLDEVRANHPRTMRLSFRHKPSADL